MQKFWIVLLMVCLMSMMAAPTAMAAADKININTATVGELTELQKVGPKTAERIVAYRDANGPFQTVDDLVNVKGVGDKILELNKDRMTVEKKK
jgi:competence protein ComEA